MESRGIAAGKKTWMSTVGDGTSRSILRLKGREEITGTETNNIADVVETREAAAGLKIWEMRELLLLQLT